LLGAAAFCQVLPGGQLEAQEELVLEEDFSDADTPLVVFPRAADGACGVAAPSGANAACVDLDSGRLVLTSAFKQQVGIVWIERPLDLTREKVAVEFDLHLSVGSAPPGDGFSVVFQEGDDLTAMGRSGGALGTGGLAGAYVSAAIDFYDNGDHDPESPCDVPLAATTCHAEVNWSSDPETEPSLATSTNVPDFLAAMLAQEAVHVRVTLDGRELVMTLSSNDAIHVLLPAVLGERTILGLTATTGTATAVQAVDNLRVTVGPSELPVIEWEAPAERGGINCGGPAFTALIGGASIAVSGEAPYGEIASVVEGTPRTIILRGGGRIPAGDDFVSAFEDPIEGMADPSLAPMYSTEAWSRRLVHYRQNVTPGRYEVTLHFAENCTCGISRSGRPARRYDLQLQGTDVLRSFSPAEAAGKSLGSCEAIIHAAVTRTFATDVLPGEDGLAAIEVKVKDLGGGDSPEDAQLNGFTFVRLADATGEPLAGEMEDLRPPAVENLEDWQEILRLDFEGFPDGTPAAEALDGLATVNPGRFFAPAIAGGRLRLADDSSRISACSVIFDKGSTLVFDPLATRLRVEFDAFFENLDETVPAEGLVCAIVSGRIPQILGTWGGSLGFGECGVPGIGVEVDLWKGGGFGDDSGYNVGLPAHVAIIGGGASPATVDHVQDHNDFDPTLGTMDWIDWLAPEGVHMEVIYYPEGIVEAFATAHGGSFPRRQVLGSYVTPFESHEALLGFFAATGVGTANMAIDNLVLQWAKCIDQGEVASIAGEETRTVHADEENPVTVEFDGSGSSGGPDEIQELVFSWSVIGPFAGASILQPCRAVTPVVFSLPGIYEVSLKVDDRRCEVADSSVDTVLVEVKEPVVGQVFVRGDSNCDNRQDISDAVNALNLLFLGIGATCCDDACDTNDDGRFDISDPVAFLNFLFLGGKPPELPYPACGVDPKEDLLSCGGFLPCS
jgi:hypothetical protein